jgi:hypothetical protein
MCEFCLDSQETRTNSNIIATRCQAKFDAIIISRYVSWPKNSASTRRQEDYVRSRSAAFSGNSV